jgi:hypothetical protein
MVETIRSPFRPPIANETHFIVRTDEKLRAESIGMKYWEIIADNLSKAGWSWGCVSGVDSNGRTIFVADAHRVQWKAFRCACG